jgi:transposase-like protein
MSYKNNDLSSCRKHPSYYSDELKQRLAASASQPGVSLSSLAQGQGVSVSALSRWRK